MKNQRFRGKRWNKEIWFSICSRHQGYDSECDICQHGSWNNYWLWSIEITFDRLLRKLKIKKIPK